ncbi:MAG: hypothetical protein RSC91_09045 [Clostridia bacterium]
MKPTQNDLKRMYGTMPDSFKLRVSASARRVKAEQPMKKRLPARALLIAALILVSLTAVAMAAFSSQVAAFFGDFYGQKWQEELDAGEIAQPAQSVTLGEVTYTLDETICTEDGMYGIGFIRPAQNSNVILLSSDYAPSDPAGYDPLYGDEAPEDAISYAELARQNGSKLLMVIAVPEAVGVDDGEILDLPTVGYTNSPMRDGSVRFAFEIPEGVEMERGTKYALRISIANWEVTPEGEYLREKPHNTKQEKAWIVEFEPAQKQKEGGRK